ncbi:MAG: inositol monophosphatase family protein [Gammaproteobacteria bacterium]|nr:inositol monophosphatase family protein [Gammaproteobacteria bacterium]MDE0366329.1 inositol monophosphatase family protein [Gammaproteobacteria bacterium]
MHPMANTALRAARRAGQILLQGMDRLDRIQVEEKAPNDFVSSIDRAAEDAIADSLRQAYPDCAIRGEERGLAGPYGAEATWIVDPLDGTLNYLCGIPHFAVSIALQRGRHIEHGVIVDPVRNEEWVASRGAGAYLNGKRIRVGQARNLGQAVLATGIPPAARNRMDEYLVLLGHFTAHCRSVRRQGSAALDLAYTAAGRVDAFLEMGLSPWDVAAGGLLVREAGGFVGDLGGGDNWLETGDILAANPRCFKAMVARIRACA